MRGDLYRGVVTRATASGVWVRMDRRWPGVEFGPLPLVANTIRNGIDPTLLADLVEADDLVLVADTGREDFVILGVLREGVS